MKNQVQFLVAGIYGPTLVGVITYAGKNYYDLFLVQMIGSIEGKTKYGVEGVPGISGVDGYIQD